MKKMSLIVLFIFIFVVVLKYYVSFYEISYDVDGFGVVEKYKDNEFYFEIKSGDKVYNTKVYEKRGLSKKIIDEIKVFESESYECIYPISSRYEFYPICNDDENNLISYHLIEEAGIVNEINALGIKYEEKKYDETKEFVFMDNVREDEYIAVWKYNGFYILTNGEVKTIDIFNKGRYSNDLSILYDGKILLPNYDEELIFSSFVILDITTGEFKVVDNDFEISYDAYIAGVYGKNVYIFDNKSLKLYSVNIKNGKVKLVGDETKGYIKIENYSKVSADVKEYKNDKITYFITDEYSVQVDGAYRYFNENDKIKVKFINEHDYAVVHIYKDNIYYLKDDNLYMYSSKNGVKLLLHYFELNFNDKNRIFVYNR